MGILQPIYMNFISAIGSNKPITLNTLNSYSFDRSVLTPAAAFRFTAGSVEKSDRLQIRSADTVQLYAKDPKNNPVLVATGFVDETDTHGTASVLEYVITGRDTVGQLVDNCVVDVNNKITFFNEANLDSVINFLTSNTRISQNYFTSQLDKSLKFLFATSPGETKINTLQRYLEFNNGLIWADTDGTLIIDKPDFTQDISGSFIVLYSDSSLNNVMEFRVRRNINQAIRQIVVQQNGTEGAASVTAQDTLQNADPAFAPYAGKMIGRSVSKTFNYASGNDVVNQSRGVGKGSYSPETLSKNYAAMEVARENMKILDVEIVVDGHFNSSGTLYNVDQIYNVVIEDEDVSEPMYVYNVNYELTPDHGTITHLHLCKLWTICAYVDALQRVVTK